ncbi:MAG: hypothetical protein R3220_05440, partial [Balneolaceae bacterium]|nr:hypothetical protein [Balneolaceae bacterium]
KDERDFKIESYGLRYAYNFAMIVLAVVLVNSYIGSLFGEFSGIHHYLSEKSMLLHVLFLVIFLSNLIKRSTMIYFYRKPV